MDRKKEARVNRAIDKIEKAFKVIKTTARRFDNINPADLDEIAKDINDWIIEPLCVSVVAD